MAMDGFRLRAWQSGGELLASGQRGLRVSYSATTILPCIVSCLRTINVNVVSLTVAQRGMRALTLCEWSPDETSELVRFYHLKRDHCGAMGFAYGTTELNDPQFYVLGSSHAQLCTGSVSRLARNDGRWYVIEDG